MICDPWVRAKLTGQYLTTVDGVEDASRPAVKPQREILRNLKIAGKIG
jgi:hypothetical protein